MKTKHQLQTLNKLKIFFKTILLNFLLFFVNVEYNYSFEFAQETQEKAISNKTRKKSYLFDMRKAKTWILLANVYDVSLMKNNNPNTTAYKKLVYE